MDSNKFVTIIDAISQLHRHHEFQCSPCGRALAETCQKQIALFDVQCSPCGREM